ncbi:hypothetical protein TMatcc_000093 [Talaromyces marneffei ATCC 18224]
MAEPSQRTLWCAFLDDLQRPFSVDCALGVDTIDKVKNEIWSKNQHKLARSDYPELDLYSPSSPVKNILTKENLVHLHPRKRILSDFPRSNDPEIDVVIIRPQEQQQRKLPYKPPRRNTLLGSLGRAWDYQVSPHLIRELRRRMLQHYTAFIENRTDKQHVPLYLFLSGAGTGKSRNAAELHKTAFDCFNGTHFPKNDDDELARREDELARLLENPFVFHITMENGTSINTSRDENPWKAIGSRMLLQLLGEPDNTEWHQPFPEDVLDSVINQCDLETRAIFIIVDGLHNVTRFGEDAWDETLTNLGQLAHWGGFVVVCATSTVSGPVEHILKGSRRIRVSLPCEPLEVPTIDQKPVIETKNNIVAEMLVKDCDGHGRALEMVSSLYRRGLLSGDPGPDVKEIARQLSETYAGTIPDEPVALSMVKAVMVNKLLKKNEFIPGTQTTPDAVCQNGLIRFQSVEAPSAQGYLRISYMWILVLCITYPKTPFFEELQFLDYRAYRANANPGEPGRLSWEDFESIMVKVRKIKSHAFDDGVQVTIGDIHRGAVMSPEIAKVSFTNYHLSDIVSKYKIEPTWTNSSNEKEWKIETASSETLPTQIIDLREHKHIVLNGKNASDADAFLSLDSISTRNEVHQYKDIRDGSKVKFNDERKKAAGDNDIFCLFCTSNSPKLLQFVPYGSVVVTAKNWNDYFGPYAARSFIYARKAKEKKSDEEISLQGKKREYSQIS